MSRKNYTLILPVILAVLIVLPALAVPAYSQEVKELKFAEMWDPAKAHFNPYIPGFPGAWGHLGVLECLAFFSKGIFAETGSMEQALIPWLAEKWEWKTEAGKLVFYIYLRKGVKWHHGKEFTSKDVWTHYMIGKALRWPIWRYVVKVETPDKYTVKVYVKERTILTEFDLLYQYGKIASPYDVYGKIAEMVAAGKEKEAVDALLKFRPDRLYGTGPFRLTRVTPSEALLEKWPEYWKPEVLDRLPDIIRIIRIAGNPDAWALYSKDAIEGGWYVIPPAVWMDLSTKPWARILSVPDFSGFGLIFNYIKNKYLWDVRVRQAFAYIIDREKAAAAAYATVFKPIDKPTSVLMELEKTWILPEWWDKLNDYKADWAKAEALLKEAGFTKKDGKWYTPDGKPFKLVIIAPGGWTDWVSGMENIASQLRAFGFDIEFKTPDSRAYWSEWINKPHEYDWDIGIIFWGGFHPHPWRGFYIQWLEFFLERWPTYAGEAWEKIKENFLVYEVEGKKVNVEKIIEEWLTTFDVEKQKEYVSILAYIINKYLPILPVAEKYLPVYVSITRVEWAPFDHPIWYNAPGRCAEMMFFQFWLGLAKIRVAKPTVPPEVSKRLEELGSAIEGVKKTVSEIISTVEELREAIEKVTVPAELKEAIVGGFEKLSSDLAKLSSDLTKLGDTISGTITSTSKDLSTKIDTLSKEVSDLKSSVEGLSGTMNAILAVVIITLIVSLISLAMVFRRK